VAIPRPQWDRANSYASSAHPCTRDHSLNPQVPIRASSSYDAMAHLQESPDAKLLRRLAIIDSTAARDISG